MKKFKSLLLILVIIGILFAVFGNKKESENLTPKDFLKKEKGAIVVHTDKTAEHFDNVQIDRSKSLDNYVLGVYSEKPVLDIAGKEYTYTIMVSGKYTTKDGVTKPFVAVMAYENMKSYKDGKFSSLYFNSDREKLNSLKDQTIIDTLKSLAK